MSPKRWFFLLLFYISYLMFGASIYYHIEHNLEKHQRAENLKERIEINEYLVDQLSSKDHVTQAEILNKVSDYCGKKLTNYTLDLYEDPYRWTFYHSLFFAFTVCSTVGYGNLSPSTTLGRMIMIAYSLIGIPINGILFAGLGEYFSRTFISIYQRYKKYKMSNDDGYVPRQFGLCAIIAIALLPGIGFFIILPSCLFTYFENWPFSLSIYYSYVTTTTIGFGDYVPTFQNHQEREFGWTFVAYQIFIIFWFIFSLGYLLMIMTFITKGLRSKKLAALEHQLSHNIRATQTRIWHGVTKDVGYLRQILNELYIMKFKPVYNEPGENLFMHRSISCPDLEMYRVDPPIISRKRAFSESYDVLKARSQLGGTPLIKRSSESDLSKINKEKTFETAEAFKNTTDLLAKVVTALANMQPPIEDIHTSVGSMGNLTGYHGFSDSQILSSEWSSMSEIPKRVRSSSDFYITPRRTAPGNEWTWSGDNNQIQQAINSRVKSSSIGDNFYKTSFQLPNFEYTSDDTLTKDPRKKKKFSIPDGKTFFKKLLPFKKRGSTDIERRMSIASVPETPEKFPPIDCYSTITAGQSAPYGTVNFNIEHSHLKQIKNPLEKSSVPSIPEKLGDTKSSKFKGHRGSIFATEMEQSRKLPSSAVRERRTSVFLPNPNNRRGSLFAPPSAAFRRGSLFTDSRASIRSRNTNRRPSMFSVPSKDDVNQDLLETTTIADLIRALEVMHTHANLQQPLVEYHDKKRKLGTASLTPPNLPPLFSIFSQQEADRPDGNSTRAQARRSTIFGSLTPTPPIQVTHPVLPSRRMSAVPISEPPPMYREASTTPKFNRRFSIRPTNLQTPPGKAPPPIGGSSTSGQPSQTALQRRLSLRPSPLARELTAISTDTTNSMSRASTRLLPPQSTFNRGVATSSTHSPLSRMAQISQAHRKSSLADGHTFDKSKKEPK